MVANIKKDDGRIFPPATRAEYLGTMIFADFGASFLVHRVRQDGYRVIRNLSLAVHYLMDQTRIVIGVREQKDNGENPDGGAPGNTVCIQNASRTGQLTQLKSR